MTSATRASRTLRPPQHFHAEVFCFERVDEHGAFIVSTRFDLPGADLAAIRARALALAEPRQANAFIKDVRQCAEPAHLA